MIHPLRAQQVLSAMIWYVMSLDHLKPEQNRSDWSSAQLHSCTLHRDQKSSADTFCFCIVSLASDYHGTRMSILIAVPRRRNSWSLAEVVGTLVGPELTNKRRVIAHIQEASFSSPYTSLPIIHSSLRRSTLLRASTTQTSTPTVAYASTSCETSGAQP